ncbi:MAG: hypothetical protein JWO73_581 [Candidatus Taylorbacteria bacterium]|nr:hypothetical protein [Candidatus Taylorbacteria bacterium]
MFKPNEYLLQKAIDSGNLHAAIEIASKTGLLLTDVEYLEIVEHAAERGEMATAQEAIKRADPNGALSKGHYEKIICASIISGKTEQAVEAVRACGRPFTATETKRLIDLAVMKHGFSKTLESLDSLFAPTTST